MHASPGIITGCVTLGMRRNNQSGSRALGARWPIRVADLKHSTEPMVSAALIDLGGSIRLADKTESLKLGQT